jgi:hypothetical protein
MSAWMKIGKTAASILESSAMQGGVKFVGIHLCRHGHMLRAGVSSDQGMAAWHGLS